MQNCGQPLSGEWSSLVTSATQRARLLAMLSTYQEVTSMLRKVAEQHKPAPIELYYDEMDPDGVRIVWQEQGRDERRKLGRKFLKGRRGGQVDLAESSAIDAAATDEALKACVVGVKRLNLPRLHALVPDMSQDALDDIEAILVGEYAKAHGGVKPPNLDAIEIPMDADDIAWLLESSSDFHVRCRELYTVSGAVARAAEAVRKNASSSRYSTGEHEGEKRPSNGSQSGQHDE